MNPAIAGGMSGLLMASVFITVSALILFSLMRQSPETVQRRFGRPDPFRHIMAIVLLSYLVWASVGAGLGFAYGLVESSKPGDGLGSPNLVFTCVVAGTVILASPLAIPLRRVWPYFLALVACFVGIFGWFLPALAS